MSIEQLEQLNEEAIEIIHEAARCGERLAQLAVMLREVRAKATDVAVELEQEPGKRMCIDTWTETIPDLEAAADVAIRGPMPVKELRDEILASLRVRIEDEQLATERANNLSMQLRGRVIRVLP